MKYITHSLSYTLLAVVGISLIIQSCDQPPFGGTEGETPNNPPQTTMANVPVEGDTLFANVTLHWDGGDNDGFVDHYEWRYATVDPQTGDTTNRTPNWDDNPADSADWNETDQTSLTITFSSPNPINKQIFKVRAVDNSGAPAHDTSTVTKTFYTEQTQPPEVTIATPGNNSEQFYLPEETDWFQGIQMTYEGEDADGEIIEYGWAVNDRQYTWTADTSVIIPPSAFSDEEPDTSGYYTIRLTARDDTDLTSDDPATVRVDLVEPTFDKGVLVIDETDEGDFQRSGSNVSQYSDEDVDSIYSSWIHPTEHTNWDYFDDGMPSREVLGQYKMVFWHGDNWYGNSSNAHNIGNHTDVLSEYMNVGGDFIMSGWKMLQSLRPGSSYPLTFQDGSFELDYLHIQRAGATGATPPGEMVGATGVPDEYEDVTIDSAKIQGYPAGFFSNMVDVNLVLEPAGFTSQLYTFQCRPECGQADLRGRTIAVRYFGTSFDAVAFGFPLFFMKEEDAAHIMDQLMINMGYRDQPAKTIR